MPITKNSKQLVKEANAKIQTLSLEEAKAKLGQDDVQFVDIRDVRELEREGTIPGALHAPRGMLEFWVDPDSPYFRPVFAEDKLFILYCQSSWRSALATAALQDMGLSSVCHFSGGYGNWKKSGGPTIAREKKSK